MSLPPLVLASASPRRRELLAGLGLHFQVLPVDVDERPQPGEPAGKLACRLATAKAQAAAVARPGHLVLGADTVVAVEEHRGGELLGKPADAAEARAMLQRLSGRCHRVLTGMALVAPGRRSAVTELATTEVTFARLSARLIDWYLTHPEAYDKAGAYGVQGRAALFVSRLEGSWTNVVGLPLDALPRLFDAAGHPLERFLAPDED